MHVLAMSCNGQVAMYGFNEYVFFLVRKKLNYTHIVPK